MSAVLQTYDDVDNRLRRLTANSARLKKDTQTLHKKSCYRVFNRFARKFYRKLGINHLVPLIIIILYTLMGAAIFQRLERNEDIENRNKLINLHQTLKRQLIRNAMNIAETYRTADSDFKNEFAQMVDNYENSLDIQLSNESDWDYINAVYFAGTIFTTIGFGNIACTTVPGRLFTMIYAMVGIPLLLFSLNDLGKWLFRSIHRLIASYTHVKQWLQDHCQLCKRNSTKNSAPSRRKSSHAATDKITSKEHKKLERAEPHKPHNVAVTIEEEPVAEEAVPLSSEHESSETGLSEEILQEAEEGVPQIPVVVALLVTIGWIFLIAALFLIWEKEWDYFTAIYFFFISLSTIGLGDVVPNHPEYMVLSFGFVIIGLSLVSMCIGVIQQKLEDLYLQLLLMVLKEYESRLASGEDQVDATMGMMHAWGENRSAKYLLPFLSADKKHTVVHKFHDEAKSHGKSVPALLKRLDFSGLPTILTIKDDAEEEEFVHANQAKNLENRVEIEIKKAEEVPLKQTFSAPRPSQAEIVTHTYETDTQTDTIIYDNKQQQTADIETTDHTAQTVAESRENMRSCAAQTYYYELVDAESQTHAAELREEIVQTIQSTLDDNYSQTECAEVKEQQVQTHLYDLSTMDAQTDPILTKNQRLQTSIAEVVDAKIETELIDPETKNSTQKNNQPFHRPSQLSPLSKNLAKRLHKAFLRKKALRQKDLSPPKPKKYEQQSTDIAKIELEPVSDKNVKGIPEASSSYDQQYAKKRKKRPEKAQSHEFYQEKSRSHEPNDHETSHQRTPVKRFPKLPKKTKSHDLYDRDKSLSDDDDQWVSDSDDSGDKEALVWDPRDGMHAEKQKTVSDLKAKFERKQSKKFK